MTFSETKQGIKPFIKWVGGKGQLLPELNKHLPKNYGKYYEPFIGGGALLLDLAPKNVIINDFNHELTNTWQVVKNKLPQLIELLKYHTNHDTKEYYLELRQVDRTGELFKMNDVERAARFIYMNKAGFNGLYRLNAIGQNNVPYGSHKKLNLISDNLKLVSQYLNSVNIDIRTGDYRDAFNDVAPLDFVYFDPPYIPMTPTASFTNYTAGGFNLIQQEELRDFAWDLAELGVNVMLSNSDTSVTRHLYSHPMFKLHEVEARRLINRDAKKRGKVGELIITTY